jgi:hypothetical protein
MAIKNNKLINESFKKNPKPFFIWLAVLVVVVGAFLGLQWGLKRYVDSKVCEAPFNRVTNRDFSVFLWQNPQYMRAHARRKSGYLPAFQYLNRITVEPELADNFVQAPPELLFLFHTWDRQIGDVYIPREIDPASFTRFLDYAEEWQPKYWEEAPQGYAEMVEDPAGRDLQKLPLQVKQSYVGWLNYFEEGSEIVAARPTYGEMERFLQQYPKYARNYWKNVISDNYLKSYALDEPGSGEQIPPEEVAGFLKAAFYNFNASR